MTLEEQVHLLGREEIVEILRSRQELLQTNQRLSEEQASLQEQLLQVREELTAARQQLEWFIKQNFGEKSERRPGEPDARQLTLGQGLEGERSGEAVKETVKSYERRVPKQKIEDQVDETGLRFDSNVPVETIEIPNPEAEGLEEGEDYEVIGEKETHRLAQRPAAYVVLRFVRKVIKLKGREELLCPPAPPAVLEKSYADVSFLAGMLVDKFLYHLPLYRQHQRLKAAGIELSRQTLTNYSRRAIELLGLIYEVHRESVVSSEVLMMDETPMRAGRAGKGKMHQGYFWVLYGDKDELAFIYSPSRGMKVVQEVIGKKCRTLLTDGYEAYSRYAARVDGVVHAQCWAHARRHFVEAEKAQPALVSEALERIRLVYEYEKESREKKLEGPDLLAYRGEKCRPVVYEFFEWLQEVMSKQVMLPTDLFLKAASYALEREVGLKVFLSNPDVPLDTNNLERGLRPIPMGRKNWLFCWTELGAEHVGMIQSLLQTCRLHGVDPYTYLVDVLQRIDIHPAKDVALLTPRLWKENFAVNTLRSVLDHVAN